MPVSPNGVSGAAVAGAACGSSAAPSGARAVRKAKRRRKNHAVVPVFQQLRPSVRGSAARAQSRCV